MYRVREVWPGERMKRSQAFPAVVGRVLVHDLLEQQVGDRGQAHRGAGVAGADLLHGVGGKDAGGVNGSLIGFCPLEVSATWVSFRKGEWMRQRLGADALSMGRNGTPGCLFRAVRSGGCPGGWLRPFRLTRIVHSAALSDVRVCTFTGWNAAPPETPGERTVEAVPNRRGIGAARASFSYKRF